MLGADSRVWLANNREVYTRISRLTSSAWNIMRKERHWWRHSGDHDRRSLSLPLRCDRAKLSLYDDLSQIKGILEISKMRKRFIIWQTSFEHGINSLHLVCSRGYGHFSTLSIAIPGLAFDRAWYCDAACGTNSRIRGSKQRVTDIIHDGGLTNYMVWMCDYMDK